MSWQTFANLAGGSEQLSLLDTLANNIAQTVVTPCTASGTNAISLVPSSVGAPAAAWTAYQNFQCFAFVVPATSTGNVTLQFNGLGQLPLFATGGVSQIGSGGITINTPMIVMYSSTLGSGGGFVIVFGPAAAGGVVFPITAAQGGTGLTSWASNNGTLVAGTSSTAAVQVVAPGTANQVLTSNGPNSAPTFQAAASASGSLVQITTYTSTQTITIPATATKAFIRLVGAGGGASNVGNANGGAGAGYLEKYLSGLTSGNTLSLTIGAAAANAAGGASTLASGSQSITTLTANGGAKGTGSPVAGGTATNGDINVTGDDGNTFDNGCPAVNQTFGGGTPLGGASSNAAANNAVGKNYGGGAIGANQAGGAAVCIIAWYT